METQKTQEERIKEIKAQTRVLKENRTERNRPTVWFNSRNGHIEIHFNNKTMLAEVIGIDTETSREDSDSMAKGSGFKQIIYQTQEDDE